MKEQKPIRRPPRVPVPGPGAHSVPSIWNGELQSSKVVSSTSFSVPKDPGKPTPRADKAGPGHYDTPCTDSYLMRPVQQGFGHEKRQLLEALNPSNTPGPENEPGDNAKFHRPPQFSFGSTPRKLRFPGGSRGSSTATEPANLPGTTEAERRELFPGPGQHDPDQKYSSKVASTLNFTNRARHEPFTSSKTHNPGPGAYDMPGEGPGKLAPRPKIGSAGRMLMPATPRKDENKLNHGPPGPGHYAAETTTRGGHAPGLDSAPKWSMGGRPGFDISHGCC